MKKKIEDKIRDILSGIDEDDVDYPDGWWETSVGAEFGKKKLEELLLYLNTVIK